MHEELCIPLASIKGHFVRLDTAYTLELIHLIVNTLQALGHDLEQLSPSAIAAIDFNEDGEAKFANRQVIDAVLHRFTRPAETGLRLDGDEIAAFSGRHVLLRRAREPVARTTLLAAWREETPLRFRDRCVLEARLQGHYVEPTATQVRHLSAAALPADPRARVQELFAVRERWTEAELSPWLASLPACIDPATGQVLAKAVASILLKFAKKVKVGKTFFFEAR